MASEEESAEAAAEARRERLRALRAAQELFDTPDDDDATDNKKKPEARDSFPNNNHNNNIEEEGNEEELSIEQAAMARRERLTALRAAQELVNTQDDGNSPDVKHVGDDDEDDNVSMKFRNYLPHDKLLQEGKLAPPVLPKFEDPVSTAPPAEEKKEDPFLNIAPKKPNWDLQRDVQKKLDELEKRTQKAILQLMAQEKEKKLAEEEGRNGAEVENEYM